MQEQSPAQAGNDQQAGGPRKEWPNTADEKGSATYPSANTGYTGTGGITTNGVTSATKGDSIIRLSHWQLKEALLSCVEKGSGKAHLVLPSLCVATRLCQVIFGVIPYANSTRKMAASICRMVICFARMNFVTLLQM
ncbi:MAG: hypothetical protein IM584_02515 [Chitinophagaceae bacterium]|nr:hypothetical protein [Chitinophagaceae bacterium]MCA6452202.1 hypothetical protein [Chitinophagaceae bacterium]MCA6454986.1 hypothetical protein [Chitinophagaceae bacterium]MCA6459874.1 hypothetical protein [Chitinophagaceae bacterium]MCA6465733.1 hypothetical protein [Chitinophagaceae bacterium]